jgi:hypothetical protein
LGAIAGERDREAMAKGGIMRDLRHTCILASTAFALLLTAAPSAVAQIAGGSDRLSATFDDRYPAEPGAQPPSPSPPKAPEVKTPQSNLPETKSLPKTLPETLPETKSLTQTKTLPPARTPEISEERTAPRHMSQNVAQARAASTKRPRARVVVEPRSFLDAGTEVLPGQRKFLDYAFPPTHTPMDVVQNTGGRVGWHNSPLPGPFFPSQY